LPRPGRAALARGEREGWKEARRSRRFGIRRVFTTAAAVIIGGSSTVLACPVCFGAEETAMIDGTKLGILVMLAITFAVQGGFVGFFLYLRRRAKRIAEVELDTEWSELQKASRTP
jgi:MFS-type transporter involved in bile tolerance (Atg22 family)